jgi:hypothetical protein
MYYPPRTNGKAERFIQTALCEWAYVRHYLNSETGACLWDIVAEAGRAKSRKAHRTCFIPHLISDSDAVPMSCQ